MHFLSSGPGANTINGHRVCEMKEKCPRAVVQCSGGCFNGKPKGIESMMLLSHNPCPLDRPVHNDISFIALHYKNPPLSVLSLLVPDFVQRIEDLR